MSSPALRPARSAEAALLSELALRSKGHWGYDAAFLEACRAELTLTDADLSVRRVLVAELPGPSGPVIAGFGTLEGSAPIGELGMLFVDPPAIGQGVGSSLLTHLVAAARGLGFTTLTIDADPYAEAFYLAAGAVRVGGVPSGSIPGRVLPQLELAL